MEIIWWRFDFGRIRKFCRKTSSTPKLLQSQSNIHSNLLSLLAILQHHSPSYRHIRTTMTVPTHQLRSLYRRLLRELPPPPPQSSSSASSTKSTILSHPSPLQRHIRTSFSSTNQQNSESKSAKQRVQETEQTIGYLRAQRMYITLVERYNPGANMNEEERVRLTARRVGMDLPKEFLVKPFGDGKG